MFNLPCLCGHSRDDHEDKLESSQCMLCDCLDYESEEPPEPDGECFRGGEAESYTAEQQAKIQRELK